MIRRHHDAVSQLAADRARALTLTPVSRETLDRLDRFVALLLDWQRTTNLVAPSTLPQLWTRHIADSLQLIDLAPEARRWVDIGSGGGFPGLIIACSLAEERSEDPRASMILIESNAKKAAFLREAIRVTESPATVCADRVENVVDSLRGHVEVVTARAVAPLKQLIDLCYPLLAEGARALFHKGQDIEAELAETTRYWKMTVNLVPSRTSPTGVIVDLRRVEPIAAQPSPT
jgi:16S rRNA (guanine527-N7)-methyltransferase